MKLFKLEEKKDTPEVTLNPETKVFTISGKSYPENIKKFFLPINNWLDEFLLEIKDKKDQKILFEFKYTYLNSSSSKYLIDLMRRMSIFIDNGIDVEFNCFYEFDDADMKDFWVDLFDMSDMKIPHKIASYKD